MNEDSGTYACPSKLGSFSAAFSTKADGNMFRSNAARIQVEKNRKNFVKRIGLENKKIMRVRPSNGPNIEVVSVDNRVVTRKVYLKEPAIQTDFDFYDAAADGILTFNVDVPVALISADCIPLVVTHANSGLHGVIHVGLLGVLNNIVSGLGVVLNEYNIDPRTVQTYLGPSISRDNYDVTKSGLWRAIEDQAMNHPGLNGYVSEYYDGQYFDMRGAVVAQLSAIGFAEGNIEYFKKCTANENSEYYSHYSSIQSGTTINNFFSVVWMR